MKETTAGAGEAIAVILTDVQGDFTELKSGSLAVPDTGRGYIEDVETAVRRLREEGFLIIATQDWHPEDHISFFTAHPGTKAGDVITKDGRMQVLWPPHCVQGTENAEVVIDSSLIAAFVRKGYRPGLESYSAFRDEEGNETELAGLLRDNLVRKVVIFGLATDYCVKFTTLDGLKKGYRFIVVEGLSRGITPESTTKALKELEGEGAIIMNTLDTRRIKAL